MAHHWPKQLLIWHVQFSLWANGAVSYDYIVTNSLCQLAQDVFPVVHTLTIVEPIWPIAYQKLCLSVNAQYSTCIWTFCV